MQVTEVVPLDKRRSRVLVDQNLAFALYKGELRKYRIEAGAQLPEKVYEEIEQLLAGRARERALYLLKDRARTEAEIRRKLREGFYPEPVIERTMEFLREYRFVDDMEYGRRYVEIYGARRSSRWIQSRLMQRGFSSDQARQLLEQGEVQEEVQIQDFLRKKHYDFRTAPPEEKRKLTAALLRRGYSCESVHRIMGADMGADDMGDMGADMGADYQNT